MEPNGLISTIIVPFFLFLFVEVRVWQQDPRTDKSQQGALNLSTKISRKTTFPKIQNPGFRLMTVVRADTRYKTVFKFPQIERARQFLFDLQKSFGCR